MNNLTIQIDKINNKVSWVQEKGSFNEIDITEFSLVQPLIDKLHSLLPEKKHQPIENLRAVLIRGNDTTWFSKERKHWQTKDGVKEEIDSLKKELSLYLAAKAKKS
jgi:hypothetical protein